MRVASNKLKHLIDFFHAELATNYGSGEIDALANASIQHVLGYSKTQVLQKKEENLNQSDLLKLYDLAKELKKNIPLQYVLGEAWFYNLKFKVNPFVLIPRPETEELVELILKEEKKPHSILDLGTGSGCIPIALKKNIPGALVAACDISKEALDLATSNAKLNSANVRFFEYDILHPKETSSDLSGTYDVIVSNPPYIKLSEKDRIEKNVLEHEPHLALFVEGADEIIFYKRIIDLCHNSLSNEGRLYFELNPLTSGDVKDYAIQSALFNTVEVLKDMSGNERFLKARKK